MGMRSADAANPAGSEDQTPPELIRAHGLRVYFPVRGGPGTHDYVHAVDDIDLEVREGETLGLVGESGCGKSTLGRALIRLVEPTEGEITYRGQNVTHLRSRELRALRREVQMVFQNPLESLDPKKRAGKIVQEGLDIHRVGKSRDRKLRATEWLERVGLSPDAAHRYPHEFSGGQRQRIGIARALALNPRFVVADEPVAALDVSIRSQILNLLVDLRRDLGLTMVFVAHDLGVVGYISDRVAVMYLGKIIELAPVADIFARPLHPYTVALLSSMPRVARSGQRSRLVLQGEVPSPVSPPSGCRFRARCPIAQPICALKEPPLDLKRPGHRAACHFAGELTWGMDSQGTAFPTRQTGEVHNFQARGDLQGERHDG